ncbi:MAG: hypothetical protein R2847_07585 [Bacteroidia bacterium]
MKHIIKFKTFILIVLLMSCSKVPLTERKQINLLPESQMVAMALTSYNDFLKENPPVAPSSPQTQLVKNTGEKIKNAVIRYMNENKMGDKD